MRTKLWHHVVSVGGIADQAVPVKGDGGTAPVQSTGASWAEDSLQLPLNMCDTVQVFVHAVTCVHGLSDMRRYSKPYFQRCL